MILQSGYLNSQYLLDDQKRLVQNMQNRQYLHSIGEFNQLEPYFSSDLIDSNMEIFQAIENENLFTVKAKKQIIIALSDTYIAMFQRSKENKDILKISQVKYLNELTRIEIKKSKVFLCFGEKDSRLLALSSAKQKQLISSIESRKLKFESKERQNMEISSNLLNVPQQIILDERIRQLELELQIKIEKKTLNGLIQLYSEGMEISADERKVQKYRRSLKNLLNNEQYQKCLF